LKLKWKIVVGVIVLAAIGGGIFGGIRYSKRGIVPVQTGRVVRQDLVATVTASGEIKPKNYINLACQWIVAYAREDVLNRKAFISMSLPKTILSKSGFLEPANILYSSRVLTWVSQQILNRSGGNCFVVASWTHPRYAPPTKTPPFEF